MTPNDHVQNALDAAYATFARYPRPSRLETNRDGAKILRALTRAPLRELDGEDIGQYAGWALTTVGNVADYKHFLPRIIEQAVRHPVWLGADPQSLAEKLNYANWRTWPAREQDAVMTAFSAAWAQASRASPSEADADDWLCALAALGADVGALLSNWLLPRSIDSVLQVATLAMGGPHGAYWDDIDRRTLHAIETWLAGQEVADALEWASLEAQPDDLWLIQAAQANIASSRPR